MFAAVVNEELVVSSSVLLRRYASKPLTCDNRNRLETVDKKVYCVIIGRKLLFSARCACNCLILELTSYIIIIIGFINVRSRMSHHEGKK